MDEQWRCTLLLGLEVSPSPLDLPPSPTTKKGLEERSEEGGRRKTMENNQHNKSRLNDRAHMLLGFLETISIENGFGKMEDGRLSQ